VPLVLQVVLKERCETRNDSENWKEVVKLEYKSLMDKKTWRLIQLSACKEALGCKWILKKKLETDGNLVKCKTKLVAKSYDQVASLDYNETFSSMIQMTTIILLLV
jgi:hypothetical protein